ncbi:MAG TPA: NAD(P)H-dependent oxidoreductase subunit E [Candidatus Aminicenantes bacterium]|nr:NAD(P)H-dependent oxidoreductase subunit E [Candidatus Aminicenantes bacterium]HRY66278.1 NAD(P)H-dependent oxidoreductase subunit E [Candidatus Aminicenantes bacterium]HRZ73202.1 NAD(P)H-dependent oxidoreductase subunit E [Candidatus Aminicenantes bacterium]
MSYLPSAAALQRIEAALARYPERTAALLPVLQIVQDEAGFVGPEAETWVAAKLGLRPARVREVLTFYALFRRAPAGRHTLAVCRNVSCTLAGAEGLLDLIVAGLGIGPGQTTPDGAVSLDTVECLGNCDHAPCVQVDGVDRGPLTRESVAALIEELKSHA